MRPGDEVVTYDQEFPSCVYPWLAVERKGIKVRFVRDRGRFRFDTEDVDALIGARTRAVCLSLGNFNSGGPPIEQVSQLCHHHGIWLLVDAAQGAGCLTIDSRQLGADLISAHGYKNLCSGYGISFCYISPRLRDAIDVPGPGWKSIEDVTKITHQTNYNHEYARKARRYEPGVQNISGMNGMGASIDLFLNIGPDVINSHVLSMSAMVADRLEKKGPSSRQLAPA